ncbi:MAG TPA: hypothetical protein VFN75_08940 [Pseudonocardiaceae bacterium]|nr:hypothetical protein [Pseudonocardiaceae bacterium]
MGTAVLLAFAASALLTRGTHVADDALALFSRNAAWLLAGVAALNIVRVTVPVGGLIGPALLAAGAAALLNRTEWHVHVSPADALAVVLSVAALALIATTPPSARKCVTVAWVCRRLPRTQLPSLVLVVAVAGSVELDLTRSRTSPNGTQLTCLVLAGRVSLAVPSSWEVTVADGLAAPFVVIRDRGPRLRPEDGRIVIRLRGTAGAFDLRRL